MVREQRDARPWYYVDALEVLKAATEPMTPDEVMDAVYGFHEYRASFPFMVVKAFVDRGLVTMTDGRASITATGRTRTITEDTSDKAPVREARR